MNEIRIWAESYILHCLDEFDEKSQKRLMTAFQGFPHEPAVELVKEFESTESVTVDQVEWIKATWEKRKHDNLNESPQQFAAEIASEVFHELELSYWVIVQPLDSRSGRQRCFLRNQDFIYST